MARKSFKAKAKDRVDDLQSIFSELQNARRECRNSDLALLEEQVHLMLREWKSELHNPSSATSSLVRDLLFSLSLISISRLWISTHSCIKVV
jgi:hypothetical protein